MVCHGFGGGRLRKKKFMLAGEEVPIEDIAKCISKVKGVLWAHVVYKDSPYKEWDLMWEMTEKCNLDEIEKCAGGRDNIKIDEIIFNEDSYQNEKPGKHPKKDK